MAKAAAGLYVGCPNVLQINAAGTMGTFKILRMEQLTDTLSYGSLSGDTDRRFRSPAPWT
jgi:hypothetical protein